MNNIQESIGFSQKGDIEIINTLLVDSDSYIVNYVNGASEITDGVVSDLETNLLNTKFGAYVEAVLNDNGLIKLLISGGGSPAKHYARLAEVFHIIEQIGYYIRVIESKEENQTLIAIV